MKILSYLLVMTLLVSCTTARTVATVQPGRTMLRTPMPRTQVIVAPIRTPRTKVIIIPNRGRHMRPAVVTPRVNVRII
ncbi:MAG: hypothetical protein ACK5BO_00020 [Bacteroidota bacterium]